MEAEKPSHYWADYVYIGFMVAVTLLGFLLPKIAGRLQLHSHSFPLYPSH